MLVQRDIVYLLAPSEGDLPSQGRRNLWVGALDEVPALLALTPISPYTPKRQPIVVAAQTMRHRATYAVAEGGARES
jgi:hypothetical protein